MSDEPKPDWKQLPGTGNRDLVKLAVLLLTTVLTSGGVQRWLNADTEVKVVGNRNLVNVATHEANWAVTEIMELRERVRKLEGR